MTTEYDPAMAYLDARDRLLTSLYQRLTRMCNVELERLNESLASQGFRDNAEAGEQHPATAAVRVLAEGGGQPGHAEHLC